MLLVLYVWLIILFAVIDTHVHVLQRKVSNSTKFMYQNNYTMVLTEVFLEKKFLLEEKKC